MADKLATLSQLKNALMRIKTELLGRTERIAVSGVKQNPDGNIDLKIGGRNLLLSTKNEKTLAVDRNAHSLSYHCSDDGLDKVGTVGATLTVSFEAYITDVEAATVSIAARIRPKNADTNASNLFSFQSALTTEWRRFSGTLTTTSTEGGRLVIISSSNQNRNAVVHFRNVKLEVGHVATDWTPAPEDMQDALTGNQGQFVGFDAQGRAVAQELPSSIACGTTDPGAGSPLTEGQVYLVYE